MNPLKIWIVFRKEMLDIIRDRRTLIFMILLPLLFIPVLMNLMSSFMIGSMKTIAAQNSRVAIIGRGEDSPLVGYLMTEERNLSEESDDPLINQQLSGKNAFLEISFLDSLEEAHRQIRAKRLDAALVIPDSFATDINSQTVSSVQIDYLSTNDRSEAAFNRLRDSLRLYHRRVVENRLVAKGENPTLLNPFDISQGDMAEAQEKAGEVFGRMLPYFIILMTFSGGIFPAISLAAGEKEQKTLETLLSSPATRAELVTGKFLVIVCTGIISAALSLVGMWYAFSSMGEGTQLREVFSLQIDALSVAMIFLLIIPLALVFAGLLLTISVFARSYREAQGYMTPLNMLVILPAFASFLPGVELNYILSLVPVVNVSLVLKETLAGKVMEILPYYGLTFLSTAIFAALAIVFCARMFKSEKAIFKV